jgi:hypothetical protein
MMFTNDPPGRQAGSAKTSLQKSRSRRGTTNPSTSEKFDSYATNVEKASSSFLNLVCRVVIALLLLASSLYLLGKLVKVAYALTMGGAQ